MNHRPRIRIRYFLEERNNLPEYELKPYEKFIIAWIRIERTIENWGNIDIQIIPSDFVLIPRNFRQVEINNPKRLRSGLLLGTLEGRLFFIVPRDYEADRLINLREGLAVDMEYIKEN